MAATKVLLGANIRRFYPGSPGLSFLPDSPLVKDSRTPAKRPETGHFRPSPARDRGVNLAFFSANVCYWQVRFEPSVADGAPNRTMVCYKSTSDPMFNTPSNYFSTVSEEELAAPRPVLDNDYEIKPCRPEPHEDPARNKADAERDARLELELKA